MSLLCQWGEIMHNSFMCQLSPGWLSILQPPKDRQTVLRAALVSQLLPHRVQTNSWCWHRGYGGKQEGNQWQAQWGEHHSKDWSSLTLGLWGESTGPLMSTENFLLCVYNDQSPALVILSGLPVARMNQECKSLCLTMLREAMTQTSHWVMSGECVRKQILDQTWV